MSRLEQNLGREPLVPLNDDDELASNHAEFLALINAKGGKLPITCVPFLMAMRLRSQRAGFLTRHGHWVVCLNNFSLLFVTKYRRRTHAFIAQPIKSGI